MSIQAVAWALEQDIPGTAKLVLISLANRADHVTGHCWPSMERIAKEASCSRRSVFTYIGALKRHGYVEVQSRRGVEGAQRTNDYWLVIGGNYLPWPKPKRKRGVVVTDDDDPQDIDETNEACADVAHSENPPESAPIAPGLCATSLPTIEPSDSNHQSPESVTESERRPSAMRTAHHDPTARRQHQAKLKAAEQARKPKMVPVIQGTDAWAAWLRHGHKPTLVTTVIMKNGGAKRGWYFPDLYPPKSTGPPIEGAEFADEFDQEPETAE
jgi:hypothetical protein